MGHQFSPDQLLQAIHEDWDLFMDRYGPEALFQALHDAKLNLDLSQIIKWVDIISIAKYLIFQQYLHWSHYWTIATTTQSTISTEWDCCWFRTGEQFQRLFIGWIPGFFWFLNSLYQSWIWIAQIVKLQKSFKMIPNSNQFPEKGKSKIHF